MKFSYEAIKTNGKEVQKEFNDPQDMLKFIMTNTDPSLLCKSFLNVRNGCGVFVRQYRGTFDICNYLESCIKVEA